MGDVRLDGRVASPRTQIAGSLPFRDAREAMEELAALLENVLPAGR